MDGCVGDKSTDVRSSLPSSDSRVLVPVSLPNDESNRLPVLAGGSGKACLSSGDRWWDRFTSFVIGFDCDGTGGREFLAVGELLDKPNLEVNKKRNCVNCEMIALDNWRYRVMYVPCFQFRKTFLIFRSIDKNLQLLIQGLSSWLRITSISMNMQWTFCYWIV